MRLIGRRDVPLLAGLAAALVIVFSTTISQLLDFTRDIERDTGLTLVPALVVLTVVFLFHLARKRHESQALAAAAEAARVEAERRAQELERLVRFGHALGRSLDQASIRTAVAEHLPGIAGTNDMWVLSRRGADWEALAGDTHAARDVLAKEDLADRFLHRVNTAAPGSAEIDHCVGFPLVVGGVVVGVLGVTPEGGVMTDDRRRAVEAAAALLAVSLKNAQLFQEVKENGWRDSLTGCMTRTHAAEAIDAELRRARRTQLPISLMLLDLDRFKHINDHYGHLCGDAVLAAVGQRMREALRGSDLKCRYGGEEFVVLLPETPLHGARLAAESLRRQIADTTIPWAGETVRITASIGVAQAAVGEISLQSLLARADKALYRAKQDGRNRVCTEPDVPASNVALLAEARRSNFAG
ncbi:MAG: diguanylate cyclase [Acidobacteriota bacterium]